MSEILAPLALWSGALALLVTLLWVGTLLGRRLGVHQWGIPEALLAGSVGLLLAPGGGLLALIPTAVIRVWDQLPLILLTLVFGTLLMGKPLPKPGGLWRPLGAQMMLALTLAFGQYLIAALAVLLVLGPLLHVSPVMACLIEVAYEGGHGSAAAMGPTYERLGVEGGQALGLAMATVGLLASTVVGGLVVVIARARGWLMAGEPTASSLETATASASAVESAAAHDGGTTNALLPPLRHWLVNLALVGMAVAIGCGLMALLQQLAAAIGGGFAVVIDALPVFPLALIGSLLVRLLLDRSGNSALASAPIQSRIGTLSADLLIVAATACLDLSLLAHDWLPLTVLAVVGLLWNLAVVLLLARRTLPEPWFERGILEFGQATGVAASGLLLLNMADPGDRSDALTPFSIKQLLLQPLLAGGVITVMAPLAIASWGLERWAAICLGLTLLWVSLAVLLQRRGA
jgi:ESS family glutamate:Na+ symporter